MRKIAAFVLLVFCCAVAFAGSERQRISYKNFSGGWNSSTDWQSVQPNQLKKAYNVVIEKNGSIRPREGYYTKNTIPTSIVGTNTSIIALEPINQEFAYIDATGKAFCTVTSDSGYGKNIYVPTNADSYTANFARLGDWMVFGAEGDFLQYFYIASASLASVSAVPGSQNTSGILISHNDRIFNAYRSALYETSVGSATDFSGGEAWAIGDESEGDITGLGGLGEELYIFKTNAIYRMTGYSPAERSVQLLTKNYGTTCPKSVVTADLAGLGKCIVFFSSFSKICILTQTSVFSISEAIQETLDESTLGYSTKSVWGCFEAQRQGVLYTFGSDVGGNITGLGIYLNGSIPYQSADGMRWPFTAYGNPDVYGSSRFYGVSRNSNVNNADYQSANEIAVVMTDTNLIQAKKKICRQWLLKTQYISKDDNTGTTSAFPVTVQTRDEDAGDSRTLKGWRNCIVTGYTRYTGGGSVISSQMNKSTLISSSTASLVAGNSLQEITVPLYNFNDYCSMEFDMTLNNSFWVTGIDLDYVKGPKQE